MTMRHPEQELGDFEGRYITRNDVLCFSFRLGPNLFVLIYTNFYS